MTRPVRISATAHVDPEALLDAKRLTGSRGAFIVVTFDDLELYLNGAAAERLLNVVGEALYGVDGDGSEVTAEPLSAPVATVAVGSPVHPGRSA